MEFNERTFARTEMAPCYVSRHELVRGTRVRCIPFSLSSLARRVRDFHVEFEERMVGERVKERLLEGKGTSEVWKLELELG